ncbi:MAG: acetyltransferase [Actinomycetota bacterium]
MGADPATEWFVYACRTSYTGELVEMVRRRGDEVRALIDNWSGDPIEGALAPVRPVADLDPAELDVATVIAPTIPGNRHRARLDAESRGLRHFPSLIDPTAVVAASAVVGEGSTVNAGVVIGASTRVGRQVCVNRSASVGHDGVLGDYASLGPGCLLGGHVTIEAGAFLGVGAVCAPEVTVGANATVGAGAVVVRDVAPNTVVVGNPARALRTDDPGYGGAGVPV